MSRSRFCDKPGPANGGKDCRGRSFDSVRTGGVRVSTKKVRGGGGGKSMSRFCDKPAPANGGKDCRGRSFDSRRCENRRCPSNYENGSGGGACPGAGSATPRPLQTAGKTVEVGPSTV